MAPGGCCSAALISVLKRCTATVERLRGEEGVRVSDLEGSADLWLEALHSKQQARSGAERFHVDESVRL